MIFVTASWIMDHYKLVSWNKNRLNPRNKTVNTEIVELLMSHIRVSVVRLVSYQTSNRLVGTNEIMNTDKK